MKPELKKKWVDALRSGKYIQGRSWLKNTKTNTYCCLGVLCEVLVEEGKATEQSSNNDPDLSAFKFPGHEDTATFSLNNFLSDELELPHKFRSDLINMNDQEKKPFTEIADHIEKHL